MLYMCLVVVIITPWFEVMRLNDCISGSRWILPPIDPFGEVDLLVRITFGYRIDCLDAWFHHAKWHWRVVIALQLYCY